MEQFLNQASWNGTVFKFGSENQWDVHKYFLEPFVIFAWSYNLENDTSWALWLGVGRTLGAHPEYTPLV